MKVNKVNRDLLDLVFGTLMFAALVIRFIANLAFVGLLVSSLLLLVAYFACGKSLRRRPQE